MSRLETNIAAIRANTATPGQREYVAGRLSMAFARIGPPVDRSMRSIYTVHDPFEQSAQIRANAQCADWGAVVDLAASLLKVDPDLENAHPRSESEWGNVSARYAHEGWAEARARVGA